VRALLSVADGAAVAALARELRELGIDVFATAETRDALGAADIGVADLTELTGREDAAVDRFETFRAAVFAGILARRHVPADMAGLEAQGLAAIDLVVVGLRPFAPTQGDGVLPIVRLTKVFGWPASNLDRMHVLIVKNGGSPLGLAVDRITGQREIVVRTITDPLVRVPGVVGATELGDGKPVLILDPHSLIRTAREHHMAKAAL